MKDEIISDLILHLQETGKYKSTKEEKMLQKEVDKYDEEITNKLSDSDEMKQLLINLSNAKSMYYTEIINNHCIKSFKLGFQLCLEGLQGRD